MSRAAIVTGALVVAASAVAGCGVHGLAFRTDDRVDIVRPSEHAHATLPVTVAWTVGDAGLAGGSFGVVVDRPPPPPGKPLAWLFRDDGTCGDRGCPDVTYRTQRGVFQTRGTEVRVTEIPSNSSHRDEADHEATVFLLDAGGHRVGESAWTVSFDLPKRGGA